MSFDAIRKEVLSSADALIDELFALACDLHAHPELSLEEHEGARKLGERLAREGFEVETGVANLPTAFVAQRGAAGSGGPTVGFLAEYDALPEIGHGCGHNLIGTAALGAGIIVARLLPEGAGVKVFGTPAEETIGGKVVLAEAGVFDGLDAALMVHPSIEERVLVDSLACQSIEVTYLGRTAHAVSHPEKGVNALDPLLALFQARDALLRQAVPGVRIVGVIAEGGVRANIVPERSVGRFSIRTPTRDVRDTLVEAFQTRARAVGESYGCRTELRLTDHAYDDMVTNGPLADAYREHLRHLGQAVNDQPRKGKGSLDMGNVSYRVPSIHPFFAIAPPEAALHTREFADASISQEGRAGLLRSVQALALTGLQVLHDASLRAAAAEAHAALEERRR